MKQFRAPLFMALTRNLEDFRINRQLGDKVVTVDEKIIGSFDFQADIADLELTASLATVRKILTALSEPNCTYQQLGKLADELSDRLLDETMGRSFFALSIRETEYYNKWGNGWEAIIARFPDTIIDIEESSKSFAVSRYPGAVFHSLQVVESGLIELGTFIKVNDPKSGWAVLALHPASRR